MTRTFLTLVYTEVNMRIAMLVEEMYEEIELLYPLFRLREEGFTIDIVGTDKGKEYKGKHGYPTVSDLASRCSHNTRWLLT